MKNIRTFLSFFLLLFTGSMLHAHAQVAGDACTSGEKGVVKQGSSTGHIVCDGSEWNEWQKIANDGHTALKFAADGEACNSDKTGRIRYTQSLDQWAYCNGTDWDVFPTSTGYVSNVTCWGRNDDYNQLEVPVGLVARKIKSHRYGTCAIEIDGGVTCWGSQVSDPPAGLKAIDISVGQSFNCALEEDGTVTCWGFSGNNRLNVPAGLRARAIDSSCCATIAIQTDGTLASWGWEGTDNHLTNKPSGTVLEIAMGYLNACALQTDGTVTCWGANTTNPGTTKFRQLATSVGYMCGIEEDGDINCWYGPTPGTGKARVVSVSEVQTGNAHGCSIMDDGYIDCWGSQQYDEINDAPTSTLAVDVSVGRDFACAIVAE